MRSAILLLRLNHTPEFRHGFLHNPLQPMEIDSFVDIVLQDIIVILSNLIEYHCSLYMLIKEACHPR